jgi:predicted secreted protein
VSGSASAVPRSASVASSTPASATIVAPHANTVAVASPSGLTVAAQNVVATQPAKSALDSPIPAAGSPVILEPSSFPSGAPVAAPVTGKPQAPITFIANQGPSNPAVKFVASTPSLTASFEENAIGLQIGSQQQSPVRLEFEGTSSTSQLVGVGSTSDPSQSQTAGATFSSIRYTGLYNGIDMQVDDSGGELQYELFVAPGANIADAMIHADGGAVTVAADGSLMIQTPTGTLHQTAPVSWDVLPDGTKHPLESHFHIDDNGDYGFEVVGHDATLPMVIDPILIPAPTIVAPANGASVTEPFNISWTSVTANPSGVIGYNWEVSTSSTFSTIVYEHSVNSPTTQDVISGLASGTYFWRVQAADGAFDQGTWSTPQSFTITGANAKSPGTPVLAPPQAYTTFHPFEAGTTSWTPVPGAATYVYEVSNGDPNFGWNNLFREDNLTTTTHSFDSGFEATFYVRVYAVSADGIRGVPSNVISYNYAFNNPIGPAPVALAPIGGQTVTLPVTLQWAHVPNPQTFGYDVEVATDPQFKNIEDTEVQESFPFVTIDSLTPGTKYWRVTSEQGASAPDTPDFAGLPAVTAPSVTGTFTVSTAPPTPVSLRFEGFPSPQVIPGGTNFYLMALQLTAAAPTVGGTISLTSSNPAVAPVPATVSMPGFAWGEIPMTLAEVSVPTPVTVTATLNGVSTTAQFTVAPATMTSISASPPAVSGGSLVGMSVNLQGPAPAGGAVVSLSSSSPAVVVPPTMTVPQDFWSGSIPLTTTSVPAVTTATITAYNGVIQQTTVTVVQSRAPDSVTITPSSWIGSSSGTVTGSVNMAAFSSYGQTFRLTSSNPAVASVPATTSGGFVISTSAVTTATVVTITATGAGVSRSAQFTVLPAGTKQSVSSVTLFSSSVAGGTAATGLVQLNATAPAGGLVVALSDNSSAVTVPASVTVPAGSSSVTFPVTTTAVTAATTAAISATLGTTQSTTLQVTPTPAPTLSFVSLTTQNIVGGGSATGRVVLSAAAPAGGAVVTLLTDSPSVVVPATVTIPADAVAVFFPVTTSSVSATIATTITASFGGTSQPIQLNGSPPQAGPVLAGVSVTPISIAGLTAATATVTLSGPAPAGGAAVFIKHDSLALDQNLLGINVIVPAGATSASFTVGTYKVSVTMAASIIASYGITQSAVLTVNPSATAPALSTVSLSPASVTGGASSTGTVTPTAPVPAGGMVVTLASNNAAATVPASVTVAAGATNANFTVTTKAVTASTAVAISATAGVVTRSATLTVNPAAAAATVSSVSLNPSSVTGGSSSTGTVTLTSPASSGGLVVTLASNNTAATVPATVTVPAGATSANFTVATKTVTATTSVVISATGGGVTRSATLTVNRAAAADTVNITKVEYTASKSSLLVEATSTSSSATLQVFVTATNQLIGTLTNNGGGKYTAQFSWPTNPQNITVKSSLGGSSSKAVTLK